MLGSEVASLIRYTLTNSGAPGDLGSTPGAETRIANDAGRAMWRAWQWSFYKREAVALPLLSFQPWLDLPSDFGRLNKGVRGTNLLSFFEPIQADEGMELRASNTAQAQTYGFYWWFENALPENVNLLSHTADFANPVWELTNVTQASGATAPDGSLAGFTLTTTVLGGTCRQFVGSALLVDRRTFLFSIYVKAGTATSSRLALRQEGVSGETSSRAPQTTLDLAWGAGGALTVTVASTQGQGVNVRGTSDAGDGWTRVHLSVTHDRDQAVPNARLQCEIIPDQLGTGTMLVWGAQLERSDHQLDRDLVHPRRYSANSAYQATFGVPRRRIALWPTPTADEPNAVLMSYFRAWDTLTDVESQEVQIPEWLEDVYLEVCRHVARGWHEEDDATTAQRLDSLWNSRTFRDATEEDRTEQSEVGPMTGLAFSGHMRYRDWGSGALVPTPGSGT